jgi:hypothetical protein
VTPHRVTVILCEPAAAQPFRHEYLDQALARLAAQPDAWLTTSDEIATHYLGQSITSAAA